jgi:hypothetical protein
LQRFAFPKSLDAWLGRPPPQADDVDGRTLESKLAGLRAALLNLMSYVRRRARKLRSDAIVLKPIVARTTPKTAKRDFWQESRRRRRNGALCAARIRAPAARQLLTRPENGRSTNPTR